EVEEEEEREEEEAAGQMEEEEEEGEQQEEEKEVRRGHPRGRALFLPAVSCLGRAGGRRPGVPQGPRPAAEPPGAGWPGRTRAGPAASRREKKKTHGGRSAAMCLALRLLQGRPPRPRRGSKKLLFGVEGISIPGGPAARPPRRGRGGPRRSRAPRASPSLGRPFPVRCSASRGYWRQLTAPHRLLHTDCTTETASKAPVGAPAGEHCVVWRMLVRRPARRWRRAQRCQGRGQRRAGPERGGRARPRGRAAVPRLAFAARWADAQKSTPSAQTAGGPDETSGRGLPLADRRRGGGLGGGNAGPTAC
ncbi:unnamed protein product, partial [Prorocentrum cordatum]